jgi:hypothetical protein
MHDVQCTLCILTCSHVCCVLNIRAQAVMYRVASKGVVSGIASGNAFVFLKAVDALTKKYPDYVSTTITHIYSYTYL